jgi:hypothetical protein
VSFRPETWNYDGDENIHINAEYMYQSAALKSKKIKVVIWSEKSRLRAI